MRPVALFLVLILFTGCAPKLLTNMAGEQRRCTVENMTASIYICSGRDCGILGAVALLFTLAAVAAYHACVHQAHEEGYE